MRERANFLYLYRNLNFGLYCASDNCVAKNLLISARLFRTPVSPLKRIRAKSVQDYIHSKEQLDTAIKGYGLVDVVVRCVYGNILKELNGISLPIKSKKLNFVCYF